MVNNPKFDEGGARSKDGKGTVRSKQADFSCGLYFMFRDFTPRGWVYWSNLV